jgi:hypothetical protein|tara:strand:+ start:1217 stop:1507 length:291 start_codon:yes stop_codon:yes gene_type:complete
MSRLIKTPAVRTIKKARSVEKTSATDRDNGIAARLSWFILVYLGLSWFMFIDSALDSAPETNGSQPYWQCLSSDKNKKTKSVTKKVISYSISPELY